MRGDTIVGASVVIDDEVLLTARFGTEENNITEKNASCSGRNIFTCLGGGRLGVGRICALTTKLC